MTSKNTRMLCLLAFIVIASGCSSRDSDELTDAGVSNDDAPTTNEPIVIEVVTVTDTTDSTATPVAPVSTFQMDGYISNPLLSPIPSELEGNAPAGLSNNFVANPLIH